MQLRRFPDYESGVDVIGIAGLGISFEDLSITQDGENTLIASGDNNLAYLLSTDAASLSTDNFVFV